MLRKELVLAQMSLIARFYFLGIRLHVRFVPVSREFIVVILLVFNVADASNLLSPNFFIIATSSHVAECKEVEILAVIAEIFFSFKFN